jgi:hypothetical protein
MGFRNHVAPIPVRLFQPSLVQFNTKSTFLKITISRISVARCLPRWQSMIVTANNDVPNSEQLTRSQLLPMLR